MHRLCPVHTGEMRRSAELMPMGVARGLGTAGVPQYSVLERGGAHNTSGAVLGAGNTNVQRPASTFEDLLPGGEEKAGYRRPCTVRRGEQLRRRDQPEESFPNVVTFLRLEGGMAHPTGKARDTQNLLLCSLRAKRTASSQGAGLSHGRGCEL